MGAEPPADVLAVEDVARSVVWAVQQPAGVDINTLTVRPIGQEN